MSTVDPLSLGPLKSTGLYLAESAKPALRLSAPRSNLCCAGRLLRDQELDCNFLWRLSEGEQRQFRRIVMDMVLATDMKRHFALVAKFRVLVTHGHRASQTGEAYMAYMQQPSDLHLQHLSSCCMHPMGFSLDWTTAEVVVTAAGQQFAQLKWADSLDGLVDLSTRLHSMSALAHVPASIRCN